jgi:hypothetical protein
MVILMCRRSPACRGRGANTPQVLQRTAEVIPNQLRFSAPPTLQPWGLIRRIPSRAAPFGRLASVAGGRRIQARGRVPRAAATSTRSRTSSGGTLGLTNHLVAIAPRLCRRVPLRDNGFRTGPLSAGNGLTQFTEDVASMIGISTSIERRTSETSHGRPRHPRGV